MLDTDTRQVRLNVVHLGLWTAAKNALIVGVLVGIVTVIAFFLGWTAFSNSGGIASLASTLSGGGSSTEVASIEKVVNTSSVMAIGVVVAVVQVVSIIVLGVVGAAIYNGFTHLAGGLTLGFSPQGRR
ncbi:hypothetical protein AX769_16430 [Frondihabitans sp. PAMC 28766]|uniref:DUF3566 domain-containing protein n=1 Tax=Frondihabitans sp. PAMC 28766 TaxID=1795630 RepID=UPI00078B4324|nr:DUF3566 domain-containing protein [Frondihabitans sp. PAMC 28766]AMM21427.1 hypothetical protein AX769_16430 [Frondihabitans sp. PAMC 28766]